MCERDYKDERKANAADERPDEKLPHFFKALRGNDQKAWYTQEIYDRNMLGIINLDNK
jgi:hypothetical protein